MLWTKTTIVEPFPVCFGHVAYPSERTRATAVGPFYAAPMIVWDVPEHHNFAGWRADGLREAGWTVVVEQVDR